MISCDFCGTDWDEVIPMIEGHRGSVICLSCVKRAVDGLTEAKEPYECTMCLRPFEAGRMHWWHPSPKPSAGLNPGAQICRGCTRRAAKAFSKDPDTDYEWVEPKA